MDQRERMLIGWWGSPAHQQAVLTVLNRFRGIRGWGGILWNTLSRRSFLEFPLGLTDFLELLRGIIFFLSSSDLFFVL